jgi:hypothetical protein
MPIRPENVGRYPKDWPEISRRIRFERAGGRCECTGQCGEDHDGRCKAKHGEPHPATLARVVLTVMHMDHEPENCDDSNLLAGCQRCHLKYDAPHHARTASETRRRRKASGDLFGAKSDV